MMFCPHCRIILGNVKKEGKVVWKCPKCGYETRRGGKQSLKMTDRKESVIVLDGQEKKLQTLPTMRMECPECNNMEAEYWMVQTRSADEGMTQFFRCTKCQHTWRETS